MNFKEQIITLVSYLKHPHKRALIKFCKQFNRKEGIEIGGPSIVFGLKGLFPIYVFAKNIDGVNFGTETVWEGEIKAGKTYNYFSGKQGVQYIDEASELKSVVDKQYDFVLSCHSLEHVANPIKTIKRWAEVLKDKGSLVLILPDKENTFDIKRPYTTFEHLLNDYKLAVDETDTTHFEEIIASHVVENDPALLSVADLKLRLADNFKNRCAHHHVYSLKLVEELLEYCGFKVLYQQTAKPFHLVTVAQKI